MAKLSAIQVKERLRTLNGWKARKGFIEKSFNFKTFMGGIAFVRRIALIAEKLDHHPDIHIRWTTVLLQIQTHDEGGITERDFEVARAIDTSTASR